MDNRGTVHRQVHTQYQLTTSSHFYLWENTMAYVHLQQHILRCHHVHDIIFMSNLGTLVSVLVPWISKSSQIASFCPVIYSLMPFHSLITFSIS